MGDETKMTSSNNDATTEGLNSRTQSYTSVASSHTSRGSKLPDYDFGEDDKPGKYSGGKEKEKKEIKTGNKDNKKKEEKPKTKTKKGKTEKKEKSDKKEEKVKTDKKKDKAEKTDKKSKRGKENDAFINELESTLAKVSKDDSTSANDVDMTSEAGTSRDSSVVRKHKKSKSKKSKTKKKNKGGKKKTKKSTSRTSSKASFSGLSTDNSDYASETDDVSSDVTKKKASKSKTKSKKNKKKSKNDGDGKNEPTIIVVDESIGPRLPRKKEPLLYNCCFCCSLGAGSLIAGIAFVLICIGFLVVRAEEFKLRTVLGIWKGERLLPDVWRLLLVFGFMTASLCMLASLLLVVASCLWGNKERYERMRRCVVFWIIATLIALINNIAEAVFVQTVPNIRFKEFTHSSDSIEEIKENNVKLWALTGLFTLLFIYISLILISYLRLLKYMDSPKIGGTTPSTTQQLPMGSASSGQKGQTAVKKVKITTEDETRLKAVTETNKEKNDRSNPDTSPRRQKDKQNTRPTFDGDFGDRIYVNTSFIENNEEAGPSAPISRTGSRVSLIPSKKKNKTFREVLDEIEKDENVFENMDKPKPLRRIPNRRPPTRPIEEAIYMNHDPRSTTPKPSYTRVSKPLKRAASLSDVKSPVYDCPPPEIDLKELAEKTGRDENGRPFGSKDTGFNSRSSMTSNESRPDINEMEKLAEQLRQEREALDKSGNCDPAMAENLTQMALNALKLSEKILQDAKSSENAQQKQDPTPHRTDAEERESIQQNLQLATTFFDELSRDPNALTGNPVEEMFRMYGKDLCSQNPEMVNRYLMSYKALQDHKARQPQAFLPAPDTGISEAVMNEQQPWRSILNPSEAIPAPPIQNNMGTPVPPNPLLSSMSHSSMGGPYPPPNDPRFDPRSAFTPIQTPMSQPFHTVSHAQSGPPPPNNFYPIEYPGQNSASYNPPEPPAITAPNNQFKGAHFDPRFEGQNKFPLKGIPPHGSKGLPHDESYYDEECPYSCCYTMYEDYGSIYSDFGAYPPHYAGSESLYGTHGMYSGPNWFPMGDPAYSTDPYYNPYEYWDEPAPPYTEKSATSSFRPQSRGYDSKAGTSSRGYDSKAGTSSRGYDSKAGTSSRGYDSKAGTSSRGYTSKAGTSRTSGSRGYSASSRDYTYKSRSLPNLLDDELYSEGQRSLPSRRTSKSSRNLAEWGIENEDLHDMLGRPMSRGSKSKSLPRSSSAIANSVAENTTRDAFMKGYKTALKEALLTINKTKKKDKPEPPTEDDFIDKLISQVGERERSRSPLGLRNDSKMARTISSDSRLSGRNRDDRKVSGNTEKSSRNFSRASVNRRSSKNMSRSTSRNSDVTERLSSRRTSKLSFRPASRPGQIMSDDYYEDYRSTSSIPPTRDDLDDFGFSRKSSQNSVGFARSSASRNTDDILDAFDMMSSHEGRPSTRSRMSGRIPSRNKEPISITSQGSNTTYPYSENGSHFYNTLDLERAFSGPQFQNIEANRGRSMDRLGSNGARTRSQSANGRENAWSENPNIRNPRQAGSRDAPWDVDPRDQRGNLRFDENFDERGGRSRSNDNRRFEPEFDERGERSRSVNDNRRSGAEFDERDERSRSVNENRRIQPEFDERGERSRIANKPPVQWFMGDDDREPIYTSDYEQHGIRIGDSFSTLNKRNNSAAAGLHRSSSYPDQQRLDSIGSSKRKVTFDRRPRIKEVSDRRTSWN